jgi:MarR family transcriptional regulator, organic hydroperoxide resistance regulator
MEASREVVSMVNSSREIAVPGRRSKHMPKIYEEIKQNKPQRSPGQMAVITIFRTADVLRHAVERSLSAFGLSNEQYNVLRILRGAGENGLPTLEISGRMLSRSPNITRMLDKLIAKKLVRRTRPKEDRRVVIVSVTSQGLELLAHLDEVVDKVFDNFPPTTTAEIETLVEVLDRIREHMAVKTTAELSLEKAKLGRS